MDEKEFLAQEPYAAAHEEKHAALSKALSVDKQASCKPHITSAVYSMPPLSLRLSKSIGVR